MTPSSAVPNPALAVPGSPQSEQSKSSNEVRPVRLHTVKGGGGLELRVTEAGNPEGPAVLLVHGFCQSALSWRPQLYSALGLDLRLVALDLRGHGGSGKPEGVYTDGRLWAEDLHAVITALRLERPVLVGWSYGGMVITDYLRHYGQGNVAGAHFVGALTRLGRPEYYADFAPEFLQLMPGLLSPEADTGLRTLETFVTLLTQQPLPPELRTEVMGYNALVPHPVRLGVSQRVEDTAEVLRGLTIPVLATHGQEDRVVLPATSQHIAALVPHAELSLYPGVGHSPFWEDSRRFNEELSRFVARCR
ncbi:MAG TPA: alpha/beta hydrolase [Myxococcaceae bacterium]|jgi:pimeloyl-ACP methyl ester carboxylesterase